MLETLGDLEEAASPAVPFVTPLLREFERLQNDPEYGPKYGAIDAIKRLS